MEQAVSGLILPQIIYYAIVGALCLSIAIFTLRGLTIGGKSSPTDAMDTVWVQCISCDWTGEVPRLRKRCPMCGGDGFY